VLGLRYIDGLDVAADRELVANLGLRIVEAMLLEQRSYLGPCRTLGLLFLPPSVQLAIASGLLGSTFGRCRCRCAGFVMLALRLAATEALAGLFARARLGGTCLLRADDPGLQQLLAQGTTHRLPPSSRLLGGYLR